MAQKRRRALTGFHHVAIATDDLTSTHRFYTEAMGFELVKTVVAPTGSPSRGWAKHLFYDTGGPGLFAVWELHDESIGAHGTAISTGLGLPEWVNHLAFDVADTDALAAAARRWQEHGIDVVELDHEWCRSIYATDPNGVLVEFCCTTRAFTDRDRAEAQRFLVDPAPPLGPMPPLVLHEALAPDQLR
ncbi:MAG TPA: VOC family protein [Acidimicrobiales bacterium]|nr:VOC family protein [Acidimicrobiales bacterium]